MFRVQPMSNKRRTIDRVASSPGCWCAELGLLAKQIYFFYPVALCAALTFNLLMVVPTWVMFTFYCLVCVQSSCYSSFKWRENSGEKYSSKVWIQDTVEMVLIEALQKIKLSDSILQNQRTRIFPFHEYLIYVLTQDYSHHVWIESSLNSV